MGRNKGASSATPQVDDVGNDNDYLEESIEEDEVVEAEEV